MITPKVVDRLSKIAELYRQSLDLTHRVLESGATPEAETLDSLLIRRGELFTRASLVREQLSITEEDDRLVLKDIPEEEKETASEWLDNIREVLSALIDCDRRLSEKMSGEIGQLGEQLERYRVGGKTLKAYSRYQVGPARIIDRRE